MLFTYARVEVKAEAEVNCSIPEREKAEYVGWGRGIVTGMEETGVNKAGESRKPMTGAHDHVPERTLRSGNISGECCKLFAPRCAKQSPSSTSR